MIAAGERLFRYVGDTWGLPGFLLLTLLVVGAAFLVAIVVVIVKYVFVPLLSAVTKLPDMITGLTAAQAEHTEVMRGMNEAQRRYYEESRRDLEFHAGRVIQTIRDAERKP